MNLKKLATLALGLAFAAGFVPRAALAQDRPSYATHDNEDTIKGRIVSLEGQYDVSVRDDRGYVDHVRMHQGTIINPTGLTLSPGMTVTVLGVNQGSVLAANEIDTPYNYSPAVAYPAPYYPYFAPYAYGYPYYGYPYRFGYGYGFGYPGVAIGFNFGGYGGYHGYGYHGYGYGGYGGYHGKYLGGYNGGGYRGYAGHVSGGHVSGSHR